MEFKTNLSYWRAKYATWTKWRKGIFWIVLSGFLGIVFLWIFYLLVVYEVIVDIPSSAALKVYEAPAASELYDSKGRLLGKYYIENRSPVTYDELSPFFVKALIATEDERFYDHNGVDRRSLLRVAIKTLLLQRDASGGGSTITQQLVKNLYPRKDYPVFSTLIHKFKEMEMARRVEQEFSKDEILARYANTVSFGERAFGIRTAAHRFFNKAPEDLLVEEAALLVGMLKATSYYNPRNYPERARNRRNVVLGQMVRNEYLTPETADDLQGLPLGIDYQPPSSSGERARYFKEAVKKEFINWSNQTSKEDGSKFDLYQDGLKIYSTLDIDLQEKAEAIQKKHMASLQRIFLESWKDGRIFGPGTKLIDEHILKDPYYQALRSSGKDAKEALKYFTTHDSRSLWNWQGSEEKSATKIDSIKHYLSLLHSAILAADPQTGAIKAWIGGNDFSQFQFDHIMGPRQVGSTFKPIVYLAALNQGVDPCDYYSRSLETYDKYDGWTPRNADNQYDGEISFTTALTHSVNTVSVKVLFDVGIQRVLALAKKLGVSEDLPEVPSVVLGTPDISLYDMVQVYGTLANRGEKIPLTSLLKIIDKDGQVLYEYKPEVIQGEKVVAAENVDILNDILLNVSVEGTGKRIYRDFRIPYPVSGKTGTTQKQSDGWYIGYNPDLVIGAWVGTEDRRVHFRNLGTGSGGATALPMVGALFEWSARSGLLKTRKIAETKARYCADPLPNEDLVLEKIVSLKDAIERVKKEVMGAYADRPRAPSSIKKNRFQKKKRDKERDRRYRAYKEAVKELEDELEKLKDQLKEIQG